MKTNAQSNKVTKLVSRKRSLHQFLALTPGSIAIVEPITSFSSSRVRDHNNLGHKRKSMGGNSVAIDSHQVCESKDALQMEPKMGLPSRNPVTSGTDREVGPTSDGQEPMRKRRLSGDPICTKEDLDSIHSSRTETTVIEREPQSEVELPDPSSNISPDDYLLQLVKAQLGLSLKIKPALSLKRTHFREITEEQVAAYTTEIVGAVRNNNLDQLKEFHANGHVLNCFNQFGESLLNMACRRGFETMVEYMLKEGQLDIRTCDDSGRTPLHDACWNPQPQLKIFQWLVERDPAMLFVADRRGCTAFQYARPQHLPTWRKFLLDNKDCLTRLQDSDMLAELSK